LKPFKPAVTKSLASLVDAENSHRMTMESAQGRRNNSREDSEEFQQRLRKKLDSRGNITIGRT
jgi:adenylate cyclase 3